MTWRRRLRRRLLWAGVLMGLLLLVAAVSVLRVGAWARDVLTATHMRTQPESKERTMFAKTSLALVAVLGALLLAAPATADNWGSDLQNPTTTMLDARERALAAKQVAVSTSPDWFERVAAAHSLREPVGDVRVRIDPIAGGSPVTASTGREIEWPQIGIALALALALGLGVAFAMRHAQTRPPVAH